MDEETEKPAEELTASEPAPKEYPVKALPGFVHYEKTYANSCGKNDHKALKLYKEYESADRIRKLQNDMLSVANDRISEADCDRIIGKGRKAKFESYAKWAKTMLAGLAQR